jgi:hypothetical protein
MLLLLNNLKIWFNKWLARCFFSGANRGLDQSCAVDDKEPPNQTSASSSLFMKVTFSSTFV